MLDTTRFILTRFPLFGPDTRHVSLLPPLRLLLVVHICYHMFICRQRLCCQSTFNTSGFHFSVAQGVTNPTINEKDYHHDEKGVTRFHATAAKRRLRDKGILQLMI